MPERGGDLAVAALGVFRIPVPVPFPQAGGPVNVVAVEEDGGGVALFDTGIGTEEGEAAVRAGLAARGLGFADVRRIFVTHGHVDHYGLAQTIREASGCEISVHPRDRWKCVGPPPWEARAPIFHDYLRRCGADEESVETMLAVAAAGDLVARRLEEPVGELREGQRVRFARCEGTIVEMAGHTPGLCCALLAPPGGGRPRVLVANDHLLEKVSPNPILELFEDGTRFRALPTYFRNLDRVADLDPDWIVPGHGAIFSDWRGVIAGLRGFYARRQQKLLGAIPAEGATPVELVYRIFPQATPLELYLMIGEILGNLDLLEAQGLARHDEDARLRYFRA